MEQDDPDSTFGPMKRGDVVKNFVPYAPIKFGAVYHKRPTSEQAFPVYVEKPIVRDIQLISLPKQPDTLQPYCLCSKSCSLERAASFATGHRCHGMLAPSRQRDE